MIATERKKVSTVLLKTSSTSHIHSTICFLCRPLISWCSSPFKLSFSFFLSEEMMEVP